MSSFVEPRNVSMYPLDWATIEAYAKDQGYPSVSSAMRRILAEWAAMRRERVELSREACCEAETRATLAVP